MKCCIFRQEEDDKKAKEEEERRKKQREDEERKRREAEQQQEVISSSIHQFFITNKEIIWDEKGPDNPIMTDAQKNIGSIFKIRTLNSRVKILKYNLARCCHHH